MEQIFFFATRHLHAAFFHDQDCRLWEMGVVCQLEKFNEAQLGTFVDTSWETPMREIIFAWGKLWERLDEVPTLVNVKTIWIHRTFWSTTDAHASCHLPPFSQALIAAAYVMIVACMDCCIDNDKKANAFCHSPPFLGLGASDEIKTSIGTLTKFLKHAARNPLPLRKMVKQWNQWKLSNAHGAKHLAESSWIHSYWGTIGSTLSIGSLPQTFRLWSKGLKCWNDGVVGNNIALPRFKQNTQKYMLTSNMGFMYMPKRWIMQHEKYNTCFRVFEDLKMLMSNWC